MKSDQTPALSIVVPVYNGAKTVGPLVRELSKLSTVDGIEIVLVNDGSTDESRNVCRQLVECAEVPVVFIDLSKNFGEHNALMTGLRRARGKFIVTMDDDLQNPPAEVGRLYLHAKAYDYDVVYTYYEKKQDALWRNLGSKFANWTANLVIDKPKDLYLSSFRCMKNYVAREMVKYEGPYPYVDGIVFQITQYVDAIQVEHLPRTELKSNYTIKKLVRLWLSLVINFSVKPLRVATIFGLILSLLGAMGGIWILVDYFAFDVRAEGWTSLILTILLFSGVQMMMLGLVGEYLGRLYLSANNKPQAIVRHVFVRDLNGETVDLGGDSSKGQES